VSAVLLDKIDANDKSVLQNTKRIEVKVKVKVKVKITLEQATRAQREE